LIGHYAKSRRTTTLNFNNLLHTIRDGYLPLPESVIPLQRPFYLWEKLPCPTENRVEATPQEFTNVLFNAVRSTIPNPSEPIAVLYSGGIDSSVLLYILRELYGVKNLVAYSLNLYPEENGMALQFAKSLGVKHVNMEFTLASHLALINDLVRYLRSPTDLNTVTLFMATRIKRDNIRTVVSALGLDECQGGYPSHVKAIGAHFSEREAEIFEICQSHYVWINVEGMPELQVKFPFLEHELIKYARALPQESKCTTVQTKILLREAMRGKLPIEIVEAGRLAGTKHGFTPPIQTYWEMGLGDWVAKQKMKLPNSIKVLNRLGYFPRRNLWVEHRLATVPIFMEHLKHGNL